MHTPIDACTNASIHARNDEDVRVSTEHNPDHEIIYIKTGAVCDRFAVLLMPAEAQQCEGCIRCNGCCAGGRRGRRPVGDHTAARVVRYVGGGSNSLGRWGLARLRATAAVAAAAAYDESPLPLPSAIGMRARGTTSSTKPLSTPTLTAECLSGPENAQQ